MLQEVDGHGLGDADPERHHAVLKGHRVALPHQGVREAALTWAELRTDVEDVKGDLGGLHGREVGPHLLRRWTSKPSSDTIFILNPPTS